MVKLEHMFEHVENAIDQVNAGVCRRQREFLALVAEVDRHEVWEESDSGARDTAHWLVMRYGISFWKAHRWIAAAHALEQLPRISEAFERGELGIDKVVELTRFATPQSEVRLIGWAAEVSCATIRHRGDLEAKASREEVVDVERSRSMSWWYFDEGRRFGLEADLPAADGAVVARALERLARSVPVMPGEDERWDLPARRADALVAVCSARISEDPDSDRSTVVIHAQLDALVAGSGGGELQDGPVIHPDAVKRLLCSGRVQTVLENRAGSAVAFGRMTREPSPAMLRQVRYRDRGCRFPGCGTRAFTEAHHIVWWRHGGRTDLDNLLLICSFHHKLVHEYGWRIERDPAGVISWLCPTGVRYRAGPSQDVAFDRRRYEQRVYRSSSRIVGITAIPTSSTFASGSNSPATSSSAIAG
ncbi:MAG: HNH endonuclease [Actinobacteria bacterium]|nr:HNH endonuclease [Actinomycetota bacterium]